MTGGDLNLSGGNLDVDEDITISSNMIHFADSVINIESGKSINYTGQEFNVEGFLLTFEGEGNFSNTENLNLNNEGISVRLNGISELSKISISADLLTGKLEVSENSIVSNISHVGSSRIFVENNKELTFGNSFQIPNGKTMELLGSGDLRTVNLPDLLTLSGKLVISTTGYKISSGTLGLSEGILEISENLNLESNLTHIDDGILKIDNGKTLNYSGNSTDIGDLTLAISGGGTIENTNPLILNDPSSILSLANVNISKITVTGEQSDGMISLDNDLSLIHI